LPLVFGLRKGGRTLILPSQYYEENLYPLQDGVLRAISQSGTDFFLTGGTALSRAYYNHRYSDDLDFFVNQSQTFDEQLDTVLDQLGDNGFVWSTDDSFIRSANYATLGVRKNSDALLKLDFVNDTVPLFGEIITTDLFYRTDSVLNILSNKLSAIYRYASKDVADIREIALRETVDWIQAIQDARQKEAGIDLTYISQILTGMPQDEFDSIAWVKKPSWDEFCEDIRRIVYDMLACGV